MRILIVDDDYVSRTQIKALLSARGDCDAAPNGTVALEMFRASHAEGFPYDLVALDVNLPDLDGKAVLEALRRYEEDTKNNRRGKEARIIMISARDDASTIMKSFRAGCEGYLIKPVTPQKLTAALAEIGIA